MKSYLVSLMLCVCLISCGDKKGAPPNEPDAKTAEEFAMELDGLSVDEFLRASFAELLLRDPEQVLQEGRSAELGLDQAEYTDISDSYLDMTRAFYEVALTRLESFKPDDMSPEQRQNIDVYRWWLNDQLSLMAFPEFRITALNSLSLDALFLGLHPLASMEDASHYVEQLARLPAQYQALQDHLSKRQQAGVVDTKILMENVVGQMRSRASLTYEDDPIYQYYEQALVAAGAPQTDRQERLAELVNILRNEVRPAQARLTQMLEQMIDQAPDQLGLSQYPDGEAYYQVILAHHLTSPVEVEALYLLGMNELTRVQQEIKAEFEQLGYPVDEPLEQLFSTLEQSAPLIEADEVVATFESLVANAEAELDMAFHPVNILPPKIVASFQDGYFPAARDGSEPERFVVDSRTARPFYRMPSLAFHEGMPGHHLQIATTQALDLPLVRTQPAITVYNEGWGLYAERLAFELGWFEQYQLSNLGRLQWEALRAARLVADIGVNTKGWNWDQTQAFLVDNTGFPAEMVSGFVARFVVNPGQATAYTYGLLELLAFREDAKLRLGEAFSLKDFHQVVLRAGPMPLPLLEQQLSSLGVN